MDLIALDKCMGQRVDEFLGEFTAQYPEMLIDNVKRLEPEYYQYELSEDDGKVISNVSDGLWDKICRRIKEIDGKDNI